MNALLEYIQDDSTLNFQEGLCLVRYVSVVISTYISFQQFLTYFV